MRVASIEIQSLRILDAVNVEVAPGLNLIVGPNGSGKSSLLEAVHILGSGRSFRSYRLRDVVTHGKSRLQIVGRTIDTDGNSNTVGIEYSHSGLRIRRNGAQVKVSSELAASLPTVIVTPDTYRIVTDGAELRRRIIDRLLFHVEPSYLELYQRYRRALRQRNAAIRRDGNDNEVDGWNAELALAGEQLTAPRLRCLSSALPRMKNIVENLVGIPVDIDFYQGWDSSVSLAHACVQGLAGDRQRGYTLAGPHRADLRFTLDGRPLHQRLSRGETKLFVAAMAVAQARDLASSLGYPPVVLVDDLASELDADSRIRCLSALVELGGQLLVTAISGQGMENCDITMERKFHVKQGRIVEMV